MTFTDKVTFEEINTTKRFSTLGLSELESMFNSDSTGAYTGLLTCLQTQAGASYELELLGPCVKMHDAADSKMARAVHWTRHENGHEKEGEQFVHFNATTPCLEFYDYKQITSRRTGDTSPLEPIKTSDVLQWTGQLVIDWNAFD